MPSSKCWKSNLQTTDRSGSLIMYRRISGIAFGVTIFRNSFSIISLWDIIRNEECRKLGREPRHTGNTNRGMKYNAGSRRDSNISCGFLRYKITFYINLFPKKVEYAILLQKSCLMEAEIFEIGRETLTDSWQKNCNRHCRKPGEKECSG